MSSAAVGSSRPIAQKWDRVVGLCHAIRDRTLALSGDEVERARREGLLTQGVTFLEASEFTRVGERLSAEFPTRVAWGPGGPISNTLYAMAVRLPRYPRPLRLAWTGAYAIGFEYVAADPLASLRSVGVAVLPTDTSSAQLSESICVVNSETGEAEATMVGPRRDRRLALPPLSERDLVLLRLAEVADLVALMPPDCAACVGIATADHELLTSEQRDALRLLRERGSLRFVFGKWSELRTLELIDEDAQVSDLLAGAEVIATAGGEPVTAYPAGRTAPLVLPVTPIGGGRKSFVGAGDAYAGAFLCARLLGHPIEAAHGWGTSEVRLISYSLSARRDYTANLTELFGAHIDRSSTKPDWDVVGRVRRTCGLTIVTCGQTGVDQMALQVASRSGLAAFGILPAGRRTESRDGAGAETDDFADACVIELGSGSYRYCTWASVFVADGTLLLDYANSEGSEETRRACRVLGRPILELASVPEAEIGRVMREWVRAHAVRVLHVAGNRDSVLPSERRSEAGRVLERALASAATSLGRARTQLSWESGPEGAGLAAGRRGWRLGVPVLVEVRAAIERYLQARRLSLTRRGDLVLDVGDDGRLCYGRSYDLVRMVDLGILDAALVGSDMVAEFGPGRFTTLGPAGIFNCLVAVVAPDPPSFVASRVVSQYPRISRSYFRDSCEVVPILGAAEGWVATGEFDGAVDTWRTGRTASQHGLDIVDVVCSASLTLVVGDGATAESTSFAMQLWAWLNDRADVPSPSADVPSPSEGVGDGSPSFA